MPAMVADAMSTVTDAVAWKREQAAKSKRDADDDDG